MRVVYIDDDEKELSKYKNIFEMHQTSKDKFEIVPINAQKNFEELIKKVKAQSPQLVLVDLKLEKPNNMGEVIEISGAPISTALKEIFPEIPIVFFTKQDLFFEGRHTNKIYSSVDANIYKNDIFKNNGEVLNFLYNLAEGFEKLRNFHSRQWIDILKLINSPEEDYDILKLSKPPSFSFNEWSVSEAADWIINILIKYPGILYDAVHSATFLGISQKEFQSKDISKFFEKAKYSSIFEPVEGRWWKSKLQELAESIMNEDEKDLLIREGFPLAWERISGTKIEKSKCIDSGESPADWVCYILKKPVMIKCSLSYRPDSRPSVMDEARVSFKAIKTTNEVNEEFFDPIELEIFNKIRSYNGG